jgi:hypothetical protein
MDASGRDPRLSHFVQRTPASVRAWRRLVRSGDPSLLPGNTRVFQRGDWTFTQAPGWRPRELPGPATRHAQPRLFSNPPRFRTATPVMSDDYDSDREDAYEAQLVAEEDSRMEFAIHTGDPSIEEQHARRQRFLDETASAFQARLDSRNARKAAHESRMEAANLRASFSLGPEYTASGVLTSDALADILEHTHGQLAASASAAATLASFGFTLGSAVPAPGSTPRGRSSAAGGPGEEAALLQLSRASSLSAAAGEGASPAPWEFEDVSGALLDPAARPSHQVSSHAATHALLERTGAAGVLGAAGAPGARGTLGSPDVFRRSLLFRLPPVCVCCPVGVCQCYRSDPVAVWRRLRVQCLAQEGVRRGSRPAEAATPRLPGHRLRRRPHTTETLRTHVA